MIIFSKENKSVSFNNILKFRSDRPMFKKVITQNDKQTNSLLSGFIFFFDATTVSTSSFKQKRIIKIEMLEKYAQIFSKKHNFEWFPFFEVFKKRIQFTRKQQMMSHSSVVGKHSAIWHKLPFPNIYLTFLTLQYLSTWDMFLMKVWCYVQNWKYLN